MLKIANKRNNFNDSSLKCFLRMYDNNKGRADWAADQDPQTIKLRLYEKMNLSITVINSVLNMHYLCRI